MYTNYTCVFATKQGFVASLTFVVSEIKTWEREAHYYIQPKTHNNSNILSPLLGIQVLCMYCAKPTAQTVE